MAHWMERRYSDAFVCLVEPLVVHACDHLWIYHNLLGMVARQLPCELARAVAAFERSIELEPNRPDTLYNYANLLKDDEPERAVVFYRRSLSLQELLQPGITMDQHESDALSRCFGCFTPQLAS